MIAVSLELQAAKTALLALLNPDEIQTRRRKGVRNSKTFEDSATEIALSDDVRGPAVAEALGVYQSKMNAFLLRAMSLGIVRTLAAEWIRRHSLEYRGGAFSLSEVESEVYMMVRHHASRFDPEKGDPQRNPSKRRLRLESRFASASAARFFAYAWEQTFSELDHWILSRNTAIEIPRQERRDCLKGERTYSVESLQSIERLDRPFGRTPRRRGEPGDREDWRK